MKILLPLTLLCIGIVLSAGCTGPLITPAPTPTPSPTPTPLPTPEPIPPLGLEPRPTDVVPPYQRVVVQVTKNTVAIDPRVSVLFAGGPGQSAVRVMTATIVRSDGLTEIKAAMYPEIGTTILLSGTTRTDRVIVNMSYTNGATYTVKDERVPFQSPNT